MRDDALRRSIALSFERAREGARALRKLDGNVSVMLWGKVWSTKDLEKLLELFERVVLWEKRKSQR